MKWRLILLLMLILLVSGGCAGRKQPSVTPEADPVVAESGSGEGQALSREASGSLYQKGKGSMFTANKATRVGDILTVAIYEQASAEKEAATSTDRSSSSALKIPKLFGFEAALAARNPNLDPSSLLDAGSESSFKGSGSTSREERLSATLTTRVVEVVDGGNLRIDGSKTVRVNNEDQIIRLCGIVRPADITAYNMIDSKYILDAKIEYLGNGVISEKQRPGWLSRILDIISPF